MSALGNSSIFKAYDIRGVYGEDIDASVAYAIGRAFTRVIAGMAGKDQTQLTLGLGRDMRLQAPEMAAAYRDGMVAEGATVFDAGQVGTEMLYFLVGSRDLDGGLMCTASHNPKRYTGVKLVRRGRARRSPATRGSPTVRDLIATGLGEVTAAGAPDSFRRSRSTASSRRRRSAVIDPAKIRPLKVVVDGGNGMAGPMVGPLLERLGLELHTAYWTPNGEFPDHEPNPLLPENREFIMREVTARGADLGIAWDGDADRCFFIDETGAFVDGDFLTALMTEAMLAKNPGSTVLYDVRASRAVADTAHAHGGEALVNRVGHAFFKSRMREVPDAVFGGEVSGHYYFREFFCADSGTLPALLILELLSERQATMSQLLAPYRSRYFISGEINSEVADAPAKLEKISAAYADAEQTRLDGISIDYADWHFNVRTSNTEPLMRLCLESLRSPQDMAQRRDEVLALIRGQ